MGQQTDHASKKGSARPSWVIGALILVCAALAMCLLFVVSGVLYLRPLRGQPRAAAPSPVEATFAASSTEPTLLDGPAALDYSAEPLFGPADLIRAFSPDPYTVNVQAGGTLDTSGLDLSCGFVTSRPTFRFSLKGGASDTFLRIYFVPGEQMDTTLIIHSPGGKWICVDDPSDSSGMDPVIDFEFAPSGQYAIWVGTVSRDTQVAGGLYITQSAENAP